MDKTIKELFNTTPELRKWEKNGEISKLRNKRVSGSRLKQIAQILTLYNNTLRFVVVKFGKNAVARPTLLNLFRNSPTYFYFLRYRGPELTVYFTEIKLDFFVRPKLENRYLNCSHRNARP